MNSFGLCVSSMTTAARAKQILSAGGITASIRKSDCGIKNAGCSFEISVPSQKLALAKELMTKNGIKLLK